MSTITHGFRRRSFLLLAGIAFSAMSAGAAGDDEIDFMAFDLP